MALFEVVSNHLNRQESDAAVAAIKTAAAGKLDGVLADRQRIRVYKVGEVDQFYHDLESRVVSCAIIVIPDGTFDQFEKGTRYLNMVNNYSTLNLLLDDAVVIIAN
ncbi:hypothetical protein ASESINO_194 [Erwinia phage vB_EamM_Asesino]|uniref:Uncharacterized protein n=1 Tax=Erwinia phage vB_EamM_Asesino TaxID=1883370 RepID=A0A1B2IAB0_9CAUD|nr:hypothetical protein ASESINO_194 [Erwinia phage vB_EamM_Asesino]ANZ48207.1 hypothetical protein ASESINO_194 [Erwinia phage vB_EamM_Asesino]